MPICIVYNKRITLDVVNLIVSRKLNVRNFRTNFKEHMSSRESQCLWALPCHLVENVLIYKTLCISEYCNSALIAG